MLQVSRIVKPYDTRQKEKKKYGGMWAATACKQKQKKNNLGRGVIAAAAFKHRYFFFFLSGGIDGPKSPMDKLNMYTVLGSGQRQKPQVYSRT